MDFPTEMQIPQPSTCRNTRTTVSSPLNPGQFCRSWCLCKHLLNCYPLFTECQLLKSHRGATCRRQVDHYPLRFLSDKQSLFLRHSRDLPEGLIDTPAILPTPSTLRKHGLRWRDLRRRRPRAHSLIKHPAALLLFPQLLLELRISRRGRVCGPLHTHSTINSRTLAQVIDRLTLVSARCGSAGTCFLIASGLPCGSVFSGPS